MMDNSLSSQRQEMQEKKMEKIHLEEQQFLHLVHL